MAPGSVSGPVRDPKTRAETFIKIGSKTEPLSDPLQEPTSGAHLFRTLFRSPPFSVRGLGEKVPLTHPKRTVKQSPKSMKTGPKDKLKIEPRTYYFRTPLSTSSRPRKSQKKRYPTSDPKIKGPSRVLQQQDSAGSNRTRESPRVPRNYLTDLVIAGSCRIGPETPSSSRPADRAGVF